MNAWIPSVPVQPVQPVHPVHPEGGIEPARTVLDSVHEWFERFITVVEESDLDLLTLWAAHTHLVVETYTTPRLILDSAMPGSGKTTVLEHLQRLCVRPIQMASVSSPSMLARILDAEMRTMLIDEADRSLSDDKPEIRELLAILNSGYKRGGTRPVLVPAKGGAWDVAEMPTYSPVAMAGNSPKLPEDTKSRSIRVLLMPDIDGTAEESDWELYDLDARDLGESLASWADSVRDDVRANRPEMPESVRGRARERWAPLKRVAVAAGGRWPEVVDQMAVKDVERMESEKAEGFVQQRPHIMLLSHIHEAWESGERFVSTENLIDRLVTSHPASWGEFSTYGKRLTAQRMGRMLSTHYNVQTSRPDTNGPRGYTRGSLETPFRRFGLDPSSEPDEPAEVAEPALDWNDQIAQHDELVTQPDRCSECALRSRDGHLPSCSQAAAS